MNFYFLFVLFFSGRKKKIEILEKFCFVFNCKGAGLKIDLKSHPLALKKKFPFSFWEEKKIFEEFV